MSNKTNRWKGFVLGAVGGVAGVLAMDLYWKGVISITGQDPREAKGPSKPGPLGDISLIGKQHEKGESSTGAMGRIVYEQVTGKEPHSKETRTVLSYTADWIFSMSAAGLYGALRGSARIPDVKGGLALGVGLWGLGDELIVPALGLADGPTAYQPELHAYSLGAHLAYGLATSAIAQVLDKLV